LSVERTANWHSARVVCMREYVVLLCAVRGENWQSVALRKRRGKKGEGERERERSELQLCTFRRVHTCIHICAYIHTHIHIGTYGFYEDT
jgi:hypothetical protein